MRYVIFCGGKGGPHFHETGKGVVLDDPAVEKLKKEWRQSFLVAGLHLQNFEANHMDVRSTNLL